MYMHQYYYYMLIVEKDSSHNRTSVMIDEIDIGTGPKRVNNSSYVLVKAQTQEYFAQHHPNNSACVQAYDILYIFFL